MLHDDLSTFWEVSHHTVPAIPLALLQMLGDHVVVVLELTDLREPSQQIRNGFPARSAAFTHTHTQHSARRHARENEGEANHVAAAAAGSGGNAM
jgi:hypothetical protein